MEHLAILYGENIKIVFSAKKSLSFVLKASGFSRIAVFLPFCYWQETALLGELASIRIEPIVIP
jgi:hypothetical protein